MLGIQVAYPLRSYGGNVDIDNGYLGDVVEEHRATDVPLGLLILTFLQ